VLDRAAGHYREADLFTGTVKTTVPFDVRIDLQEI
jgi:hypothetical protein